MLLWARDNYSKLILPNRIGNGEKPRIKSPMFFTEASDYRKIHDSGPFHLDERGICLMRI